MRQLFATGFLLLAGAAQADPLVNVMERRYDVSVAAVDQAATGNPFPPVLARVESPDSVWNARTPVEWSGGTSQASVFGSARGDLLGEVGTVEYSTSNAANGDTWGLVAASVDVVVPTTAPYPLRGVFSLAALATLPGAVGPENVLLSGWVRINGASPANFSTEVRRENGVLTRNGEVLPAASTLILLDSYRFMVNAGDRVQAGIGMSFPWHNIFGGVNSSAYGIVNARLSFDQIIPPPPPPPPPPIVPEPATWAMMIAGFGLVGVMARRRVARVA